MSVTSVQANSSNTNDDIIQIDHHKNAFQPIKSRSTSKRSDISPVEGSSFLRPEPKVPRCFARRQDTSVSTTSIQKEKNIGKRIKYPQSIHRVFTTLSYQRLTANKLVAGHVFQQKYVLVRQIGQGTFSLVWEAINLNTKSHVVVKLFKSSEMMREHFKMELENFNRLSRLIDASILSSLAIVKILDSFLSQGVYVLVFEMLGKSMKSCIKHLQKMSLYDRLVLAQRCGRELLPVLSVFETVGIFHRDIKPENICFRKSLYSPHQRQDTSVSSINNRGKQLFSKPCLVDLGSMTYLGNDACDYIQTHRYRAPEVFLHRKPFTNAIDIWSLGCVLVELVIGTPVFSMPWEEDDKSVISQCYSMLGLPFAPLTKYKRFEQWHTNIKDRIILVTTEHTDQWNEKTSLMFHQFIHVIHNMLAYTDERWTAKMLLLDPFFKK